MKTPDFKKEISIFIFFVKIYLCRNQEKKLVVFFYLYENDRLD